ncbi:MAG: hypothetical protein ACREB9_00870 [Thermoplasmata archaeon]
MASTSKPGTLSITLTSAQLYFVYLVLLVADVLAAFAFKVLPTGYGTAGISVIAISFFGTLADEFTVQKTPAGLPNWFTWLIISLAAAVLGTIGQFTSDTILTTASLLAWLILVLGAVGQDIANDAGVNVPTYIETYIQAIVGGAVTVLTFVVNNPTAQVGAIIATIVGVIVSIYETTIAQGVATSPTGTTPVVG